jgi:general secretion pathway protein G
MRTQRGFTLVEILIVVVILGILAAVVIPQFTNASTEAKTSSLCTDLQSLRSQIALYRVQHNDIPPTAAGFLAQMTTYSDVAGATNAAKTVQYCYGPYMPKIPVNQFNNKATGINGTVDMTGTVGDNGGSWEYNATTGQINADDNTDTDGVAGADHALL